MANLQRPARGDPFRPSTASATAATTFPCHNTAFGPPTPKILPQGLHTTASPPRQQFALAPAVPSTPPMDSGRRRCGGGGVLGVRMCCFGDPEMKRRRRVAGYKAYAVEGKVKASLRRGLRWFKRKCSGILRL